MDQKKKQNITGLIVGIIGLVTIFFYDFTSSFRYSRGIELHYMESLIFEFGKSFSFSTLDHKQEYAANVFYFICLPIYLGLVWYYRSCIGFWFLKVVKLVYKKI